MEGEGSPVIGIVGDAPKGLCWRFQRLVLCSTPHRKGPLAMLLKLKLRLSWIHVNTHGAMSLELLRSQWAASIRWSPWVFEEFFAVGLRMPPHRVLIEILLKFRVQLHQLTPNAII
jgi:hypothetical protein